MEERAYPVFVYVHFFIPHEPFYFDAQGKSMPDEYAFGERTPGKYLEQLKYVNKLIEDITDVLVMKNRHEAVIILQGDHGYRYLTDQYGERIYDEATCILNAYYFPDGDYSMLYDSITPVNTFRIIFNKYLGARLPLLPDTSFHLMDEDRL